MANYKVKITLVDDNHAVPMPGRIVLHVGDTVEYDTEPPNLAFRVEFDGSPFAPQAAFTISDREKHVLRTPGRFFCRCSLVIPGQPDREVGWKPDEAPVESGGDHDIRP